MNINELNITLNPRLNSENQAPGVSLLQRFCFANPCNGFTQVTPFSRMLHVTSTASLAHPPLGSIWYSPKISFNNKQFLNHLQTVRVFRVAKP